MSLQTEEEEACRIADAWACILDAVNKARSKHSPCNSNCEGLMHTIVCCLRTDAALVAQANGEAFLKRRDKECAS